MMYTGVMDDSDQEFQINMSGSAHDQAEGGCDEVSSGCRTQAYTSRGVCVR